MARLGRSQPIRAHLARPVVAAANALRTGIVAYYKLDEASGNALDATGAARDLTAGNSPGTAAGVIGTSRSLDGSNQYFSRALAQPSTLSISIWVYLDALPATAAQVVTWTGSSAPMGNEHSGELIITPTGTVDAHVYDGADQDAVSSTTLATGTWYHLALVVV